MVKILSSACTTFFPNYQLFLPMDIEFVYGKGVRKTQLQRDYEAVTSYIAKENVYDMHLKICGNRNSYSKTDKDATFMRMKEDYMRNGIQFTDRCKF